LFFDIGFRYGAELGLVLLEDADRLNVVGKADGVLAADGMLEEDLGCCEDVPAINERFAPEGEEVGTGTGDAEAEEDLGLGLDTSTEEEEIALLWSSGACWTTRSRAVSSSIRLSMISAMSAPSTQCWMVTFWSSATAVISIRDIWACSSKMPICSSRAATARWRAWL